jgi:repressor LexA
LAKKLTATQHKILDYLIERRAHHAYPPTLADIARKFGYKNRATVQQHLQAIEKKGFIKKNPKLSRGIELTLDDKFFISRPVLGEVAAGNPLTIYPDAIDTVELPTIARMPGNSFLLRVKGDSLKDAYIFNGDLVIVNPGLEPRNGQVIAAIIDDAAVVKKFFKNKDGIELHSENVEYKPIHIEKNHPRFRLVGVVIGIYRSLINAF